MAEDSKVERAVVHDIEKTVEKIQELDLGTPNLPVLVERIRSKQEGLRMNISELNDRRRLLKKQMKEIIENNEKILDQLDKGDDGLVPSSLVHLLNEEIEVMDGIIARLNLDMKVSDAFSDKSVQLIEGTKSLDVMKGAMEQFNQLLNDNKEGTKLYVNMIKDAINTNTRLFHQDLSRRLTAIEQGLRMGYDATGDEPQDSGYESDDERLEDIRQYIRDNKKTGPDEVAGKFGITPRETLKLIDEVRG